MKSVFWYFGPHWMENSVGLGARAFWPKPRIVMDENKIWDC